MPQFATSFKESSVSQLVCKGLAFIKRICIQAKCSLKEPPQLRTQFFPFVSLFLVSTKGDNGGVTDSTLCRSARLHVGDDGGSESIHYKKLIGEEEFALAA